MSVKQERSSCLLSEHDKLKFQVLHDRIIHEQTFFWQRFTAFSALHAGLFVVLATKQFVNTKVLAVAASTLGLAWFLIQGASLHYVDRHKKTYYKLCKKFRIPKPKEHWLFKKLLKSTNIGFYVSIITLLFWLYLFYMAFYT
jgi:ABC-type uncharacterized transport system permease subunit